MTKLSDIIEPIDLPQPQIPPPIKGKGPVGKKAHRHPKADHQLMYSRACQACIEEDEARRDAKDPQIADEDLDSTLFFIPNFEPDKGSCLEYLKARYKGKARHVAHTVNLNTLLSMPQIQIVLLRRVARPDQDLQPIWEDVQILGQPEGKTRLRSIPFTKLKNDVLESTPLKISDYAVESVFSLEGNTAPDGLELVTALSDLAGPEFRILKRNPPDQEIVFTNS